MELKGVLSPFPGVLLRYINDEERDVRERMCKACIDVVYGTSSAQTPRESSSLLNKTCNGPTGL